MISESDPHPPVASELKGEFPILYELSEKLDHDERLGYGTSPLMIEADAVLRELWMARGNLREACRPITPMEGDAV